MGKRKLYSEMLRENRRVVNHLFNDAVRAEKHATAGWAIVKQAKVAGKAALVRKKTAQAKKLDAYAQKIIEQTQRAHVQACRFDGVNHPSRKSPQRFMKLAAE